MGVVLQHAFIMVVDNLSKSATASGVEEGGRWGAEEGGTP